METEIEAKFVNVNHDELRKKLLELGASCTHQSRLMRRRNFDYPDSRLERIGGWVRVRDEGDKTTLSYKQLNDRSLHGTKEVSIVVDDFENASKLLEAIGLVQKSYQETKRESWQIDGCQVELDEWPWVKPYLEIEAESEESLKATCAKLGLDWSAAMHGSVENVYRNEYDVSEEEVDSWQEIVFGAVPEWLASKRK